MNKALILHLGVSYTDITEALKMSDLPLEAFHYAEGHTAKYKASRRILHR